MLLPYGLSCLDHAWDTLQALVLLIVRIAKPAIGLELEAVIANLSPRIPYQGSELTIKSVLLPISAGEFYSTNAATVQVVGHRTLENVRFK